jgi:hypothetical protein
MRGGTIVAQAAPDAPGSAAEIDEASRSRLTVGE